MFEFDTYTPFSFKFDVSYLILNSMIQICTKQIGKSFIRKNNNTSTTSKYLQKNMSRYK